MIYKLITEKGKPTVLFTTSEKEIGSGTVWSQREISTDELLEFMKRVFRQEIKQIDGTQDCYVDVAEEGQE